MRSAPACAVRAASREIPAELAAHVFIVPITVAIVAVHPHVPPPVTMMPARSMCMSTVLGPTDTPRAGVGIQVSCRHGERRRSERRLLDAGMNQCLCYNGRCGQREKRNESERRQNFAHRRFPWLAGEALLSPAQPEQDPRSRQKFRHGCRNGGTRPGVNSFRVKPGRQSTHDQAISEAMRSDFEAPDARLVRVRRRTTEARP
jgi:hypothetical protein